MGAYYIVNRDTEKLVAGPFASQADAHQGMADLVDIYELPPSGWHVMAVRWVR